MTTGFTQQTNMTQTLHSVLNHEEAKLQNLILDHNKLGLKMLTEGNFDDAILQLKKAQKILVKEGVDPEVNCRLSQLSGITYNNLACYYKKTKKPKVALKYLKKALQIEVFRLNNWTSIAGTHLNICAIYSYMKNHLQAANHAQLAISFLQKVTFDEEDQSDQAKAYWNVYMLSYYNLAIQKEYLKEYQEAIKNYKQSKQIAKMAGKRNVSVLISCDQAICRLEPMIQNLRKKLIISLQKKKESDEKGYAQYITFNKKNYFSRKQNQLHISPQNQQHIANYLKKIALYNNTPTTTAGNRFRSRKLMSNISKDQSGTSFKKRVHSLTSFNTRSFNHGQGQPKQAKMRLMTQNDIDARDQPAQQEKIFKKSKNYARAI